MSLKVWLPLNGDLHNQGCSDVRVVNNGATIDNAGKIGLMQQFLLILGLILLVFITEEKFLFTSMVSLLLIILLIIEIILHFYQI